MSAEALVYTYDPPVCDATYNDEPRKPQELRVAREMSAANACRQQSQFPAACQHLHAAMAASDHMEPESGSHDGIKAYLKTMLKTNGCQ